MKASSPGASHDLQTDGFKVALLAFPSFMSSMLWSFTFWMQILILPLTLGKLLLLSLPQFPPP